MGNNGRKHHSFPVSSASNAKGRRLASPETYQIEKKGFFPHRPALYAWILEPLQSLVSPNFTREILTCDLSPIAFNFGRA
jgi:hypothetical protein